MRLLIVRRNVLIFCTRTLPQREKSNDGDGTGPEDGAGGTAAPGFNAISCSHAT